MKNVRYLILAVTLTGCFSIEKGYAESQAKQYAQSLGMKGATVNCVNMDTDGDGYVSCTIATPGPDGKMDLQPVECAANQNGCNRNEGCRVPKLRQASDVR